MSDHHQADAYDLIRTELQLFLRTYKRRAQEDAEAKYDLLKSEAERLGLPFEHLTAAREALEIAKKAWLGTEPLPTVEHKALEAT